MHINSMHGYREVVFTQATPCRLSHSGLRGNVQRDLLRELARLWRLRQAERCLLKALQTGWFALNAKARTQSG